MKVLVIVEDPTHDRYIVQPVIEAILADLGRKARVFVLQDPHLRGASEALDAAMIRRIVDENPMIDLFVLAIDRDCDREGNEGKAQARAAEHDGRLIACVAHQEVEVWMLALHAETIDAPFRDVRAECDPKERFAEPLLVRLGRGGLGDGRKAAMRALGGKTRSLLDRCTELAGLRADIDAWWRARS